MSKISAETIKKRALSRRSNMLKRYAIIQDLVAERYEEGNQSKSKAQAYRKLKDTHGLSERTFWRMMGTNIEKETLELNKQMEIEFNS